MSQGRQKSYQILAYASGKTNKHKHPPFSLSFSIYCISKSVSCSFHHIGCDRTAVFDRSTLYSKLCVPCVGKTLFTPHLNLCWVQLRSRQHITATSISHRSAFTNTHKGLRRDTRGENTLHVSFWDFRKVFFFSSLM